MAESQAFTLLAETLFDDPSQLSQALRQRAGSDNHLHFTTSSESHHSGLAASTFAAAPQSNHADATRQAPVVVSAQVVHAPPARRVATAQYVKPALPKHHSAPTSTAFIIEVEGAQKMHRSFNGMDAPGDTQPDSQMHRQWTSGIYPSIVEVSNRLPSPKSLFTEHDDDDNDEEEDEDDLPADNIEVAETSPHRHNPAITSPTAVDFDGRGGHVHSNLDSTSPLKFETPALVGRKRDSSGPVLSSAVRTNTTPGTVASVSAFGAGFGNGSISGGPLMSLTQAWHNTQAPTSPAVDGANEDVVFTRPSPNFTNARQSSPIPAYSSPIKAIRPETPKSDPVLRSSSEPRVEYFTMEQSQERRKYTAGDEHTEAVEQDSWQELSRQVKAKKARELFHRQAARSLSHVSAPTPASPKSIKKRKVGAKYSSPVKGRAPRSSATEPPQEEDDDSMDELSQPMMMVDGHNTEDSSDGLSQDMPTTARAAVKHNNKDNKVQVPKTSSHPYRTPSSGQTSHNSSRHATPSQLQRESQFRPIGSQSLLRGTFRPQSSKDSVAVMDSQPDTALDFDSIPPPKSLRFPSSPSINQYSINQTTMVSKTGFTSQIISSSMPPMPPKSSPEEPANGPDDKMFPEEEERVPSSPPILTHEDDIEYDEHAYNEYADESDAQEGAEAPAVDEDVTMDEEVDLPITEQEPYNEELADADDDNMNEDNELDLVQPHKVDLGTDSEVPDILKQARTENRICKNDAVQDEPEGEADEPTQTSRRSRRNTVPETDALDETQPSHFPNNTLIEVDGSGIDVPNHTNSTEPFQTAQEQLSGSQANAIIPVSSKEDGSDSIQAGGRIRSLQDILNLPETQQSQGDEEIEMPRLSGFDEDEECTLTSRSSPAPQSAKRRKVTYTAKRKVFRSQVKPTTDSESLSDPPPSLSLEEMQQALEDTPPRASAQAREDQGALAAAHARQAVQAPHSRPAIRKSVGRSRPTKPQTRKKGALKPITRELLQSLSSPLNSPLKSKESVRSRASTPQTPSRPRHDLRAVQGDIVMHDADEESDELAGPTPHPTNLNTSVEIASNCDGIPAGDVLVPNRVFASWPGSHYYPATCVGRSASRQLQIRFDDGNTTMLDAVHVRALDIRSGDFVKVDETGMKKHTYIVAGFKDKIDDLGGEEFPTTDRLGYATVVLEEKQRDSLPSGKSVKSKEHISVPMASIYLTTGLWTRLRDRSFNFSPPASPVKSTSRIGTPAIEPLATLSITRRGTTLPSLLKDATTRAASVASTARSTSGVFSNMAFVLTSTAADVNKEAMARTIKSNGGQVLEQGFHELFDYESGDVPSSQNQRKSASDVEASVGLVLKHIYRDLGFVALISDSHSRSTKYIQALALNVPCLHLRWIHDCLSESRALPFVRYLLPAGVSKFLDPNGVVRSRTMNLYDPAADDVSFAATIQDRDLLLHGQSVLLVTGKSKKEVEKRQPFIFLTHALGSANVGRCTDLAAATQMLQEDQWDWVYVDNGDRGVADAAAELFGTEKQAAGAKGKKAKKRKWDENEEKEELVARGNLGGRKVRITCSEFVIQSLILGALIED
ncbi:hypothetical protein BKA66DRAFT_522644 [Pyrenochaeta sp. MPI-SDFR-AT-0127]|nr:hypothetical protein BKA66DRAFT_522644 [Pyrenochaeta sp. MPI-SDFR-AT-0127]